MNKPMTCREALLLLLDQMDFTAGACSPTNMVAACVPTDVIEKCREAIANEKPPEDLVKTFNEVFGANSAYGGSEDGYP